MINMFGLLNHWIVYCTALYELSCCWKNLIQGKKNYKNISIGLNPFIKSLLLDQLPMNGAKFLIIHSFLSNQLGPKGLKQIS